MHIEPNEDGVDVVEVGFDGLLEEGKGVGKKILFYGAFTITLQYVI